jgi:hypothetical protein
LSPSRDSTSVDSQSAPSSATLTGWSSVDTISSVGTLVVLAGTAGSGAALGTFSLSTGSFSDLSSTLPSSYQSLYASAGGQTVVLLGGIAAAGSAALGEYDSSTGSFTDLSGALGGSGWGFDVNSIATDGSDFLIGGASNGYTPLSTFDPSSGQFTSFVASTSYYFATNGNVWDGSEYVMVGAKAYYVNQEALGLFGPDGGFSDYSGSIPDTVNVLGTVGWDGSQTLMTGYVGSQELEFLWSPGAPTSTEVTQNFPQSLTIARVAQYGSDFLVGGNLSTTGFLGIYYPTNGTLHRLQLPSSADCSDVDAIAVTGSTVAFGGSTATGAACFGLLGYSGAQGFVNVLPDSSSVGSCVKGSPSTPEPGPASLPIGDLKPNLYGIGDTGSGSVTMCAGGGSPSASTSVDLSDVTETKPIDGAPGVEYGVCPQGESLSQESPVSPLLPLPVSGFGNAPSSIWGTTSYSITNPQSQPVDLAYDIWLTSMNASGLGPDCTTDTGRNSLTPLEENRLTA